MSAAYPSLFAESDLSKYIDNRMKSFSFQTAMSVPSLKMFLEAFLLQYSAPILLLSTANYDCQNWFRPLWDAAA